MRDSKNPSGPVLMFTNGFEAFLASAKAGKFDK